VTFVNLQATFVNQHAAFVNLQATFVNQHAAFVNLQATFVNQHAAFVNLQATFAYQQISFADLHVTFVSLPTPLSCRFVLFFNFFAAIFARGKICPARRSGTVILAMPLVHRHLVQNRFQWTL